MGGAHRLLSVRNARAYFVQIGTGASRRKPRARLGAVEGPGCVLAGRDVNVPRARAVSKPQKQRLSSSIWPRTLAARRCKFPARSWPRSSGAVFTGGTRRGFQKKSSKTRKIAGTPTGRQVLAPPRRFNGEPDASHVRARPSTDPPLPGRTARAAVRPVARGRRSRGRLQTSPTLQPLSLQVPSTSAGWLRRRVLPGPAPRVA